MSIFLDPGDDNASVNNGLLDEDDTKILLEKEFDDFYEDRVHKSAGPVVFVSKTLGMLPVIWTEDEEESECKSYFNLYTFVIFIGKTFVSYNPGGQDRLISKCTTLPFLLLKRHFNYR